MLNLARAYRKLKEDYLEMLEEYNGLIDLAKLGKQNAQEIEKYRECMAKYRKTKIEAFKSQADSHLWKANELMKQYTKKSNEVEELISNNRNKKQKAA